MSLRIVAAFLLGLSVLAMPKQASAIEYIFERDYRECAPPGDSMIGYYRGVVGRHYRIETAPARYKWHRRRVMVRPPSTSWTSSRAVYRWDRRSHRRVLVRPARRHRVYHPAKYRFVEQRVLRRPVKYRAIRHAGRPGWRPTRVYVRGRGRHAGRC